MPVVKEVLCVFASRAAMIFCDVPVPIVVPTANGTVTVTDGFLSQQDRILSSFENQSGILPSLFVTWNLDSSLD